jgi:hypothetical protein
MMPKFLEDALKREYPGNDKAVFGTLNKIGAMKGNQETDLGREMEAKHQQTVRDSLRKKLRGPR